MTRTERAVVGLLCRLLPEGFRDRQRAEWTGDLIALSGSGTIARQRYLFAAARTLPSLRAHARRAGLDRPHAMVAPPPVPVTMLSRMILIGLGWPVLSWLISIPLRWYLLDIPGILALPGRPVAFDPKDLWPTDGAFIVLVPLWVALTLGAWSFVQSSFLLVWLGLATGLDAFRRRVSGKHRIVAGALGVALVVAWIVSWNLYPMWPPPLDTELHKGFVAAVLGAAAIPFGAGARGLPLRTRAAIVIIGLLAIAIFGWQHTPTGEAMLNWHVD